MWRTENLTKRIRNSAIGLRPAVSGMSTIDNARAASQNSLLFQSVLMMRPSKNSAAMMVAIAVIVIVICNKVP